MARPDGYDKPRKPEATPPAIDPDAKPKSSGEMESEGEREGDVLKGRSNPDEIDTELSDELKKRQARDGSGEQALDSSSPETLLPPD
ncbi:hypothetical protein [Erythrobacter sp.]|uniref:hypothetical protein n=1 Tax=Erythrobacter sp. TaxID=1042 RepID=UPI003C7903DF